MPLASTSIAAPLAQFKHAGTAAGMQVPVITAMYAGSPELATAVEQAVRAQQNNDTSVSLGLAAARILEKVVLGSSVEEALSWAQQGGNLPDNVQALISKALQLKKTPFLGECSRLLIDKSHILATAATEDSPIAHAAYYTTHCSKTTADMFVVLVTCSGDIPFCPVGCLVTTSTTLHTWYQM